MVKPAPDALRDFLRQQGVDTLAEILHTLAYEYEPVLERLERLQLQRNPAKLAAAFRQTLNAWKRSSRFVDYRAAHGHAQERSLWLSQIENELLPLDPPAALELFGAYIEADAKWFEQADDSNGLVGGTIREACCQWLRAAARCESPHSDWPQRVSALYLSDEYGARDEMLRSAHLLLTDSEIGDLITTFEQLLEQDNQRDERGSLPSKAYRCIGAIKLLSKAIRDPDAQVRAVLSTSPDPNPLQKAEFARAYLDAGRPAGALPWLDGSWAHLDASREQLLAEAYEQMQRPAESAALRQKLFERSLTYEDLNAWLRNLPEAEHPATRQRAVELAKQSKQAVTAAQLLLQLDDPAAADQLMVERQALVDGHDYYRLPDLARALLKQGCARGATVAYRAMLNDLLERAYAKAYRHGAKYWVELRVIANENPMLDGLTPHAEYAESIRRAHARKTAFWARVKERETGKAEDDD